MLPHFVEDHAAIFSNKSFKVLTKFEWSVRIKNFVVSKLNSSLIIDQNSKNPGHIFRYQHFIEIRNTEWLQQNVNNIVHSRRWIWIYEHLFWTRVTHDTAVDWVTKMVCIWRLFSNICMYSYGAWSYILLNLFRPGGTLWVNIMDHQLTEVFNVFFRYRAITRTNAALLSVSVKLESKYNNFLSRKIIWNVSNMSAILARLQCGNRLD